MKAVSSQIDARLGDEMDCDALNTLKEFLVNCKSSLKEPCRRECPSCGASRSVYCYDCCEVLVSREEWPVGLQDLELPFSVDFILDDRRSSATGIHAISALKKSGINSAHTHRLLDQNRSAGVPDYSEREGDFFLFPSDKSVGLSTVASRIRRLIVLDCRWTKSSMRTDPRLQKIPQVHLDNPPKESFFWRWHNSGEGMLSTIEATYFAAWEVSSQQRWSLERRRNLVNLLWIFGIQRAVIQRRYESGKGHNLIPHLPFSEEGKTCARKFRMRHVNQNEKNVES